MRAKFHFQRRLISTVATILLIPLLYFLAVIPTFAQVEHDLVATEDNVVISEIAPMSIEVLKNDVDTSGHELIVTQVTPAEFGTVTIDTDGKTVTYTPGEQFVRQDTFVYAVSDGELLAFAGVTITLRDPVPPRDSKGTYDGVVHGPDGSVGFIRVTLSASDKSSKFTGSARFAGKTHRFRGTLNNGIMEVMLPKGSVLDLELVSAPGYNTVTGQLMVGGIIGDFTASQHTFSKKAPTPKAGAYTVLMNIDPVVHPKPHNPQGSGWARVSISKEGYMKVLGRMGDGTALSAGVVVRQTADNPAGEAPLYSSLYSREPGGCSGVIGFADLEDPEKPDFAGTIRWRRPEASKGRGAYPEGFACEVSLTGARFIAPRGSNVLIWDGFNNLGQAFTMDGNQPSGLLRKLISLLPRNKVKVEDAGPDKMKISIASNGLVTGSFVIDGQPVPTRLTGVVFQKMGNLVEGQFLGRGTTRAFDQVGWFGMYPGRDENTGPQPLVAQ